MHKINLQKLEKLEVSIEAVLHASILTLLPLYDFFAPLRPVTVVGTDGRPVMAAPGVPQMRMARDPIVTTRDFALKKYPVHVLVGPGMVFDFVNQMDPEDQKTYRGFMDAARDQAKGESIEKKGIETPTAEQTAAITRQHPRG